MIVYDGGKRDHVRGVEALARVYRADAHNRNAVCEDDVMDISDQTAQTIAAMFHSPGNLSTLLSTMGQVSDDMTIEDFCTQQEYAALSGDDKILVDYLESYILAKQAPYIDSEESLACGE